MIIEINLYKHFFEYLIETLSIDIDSLEEQFHNFNWGRFYFKTVIRQDGEVKKIVAIIVDVLFGYKYLISFEKIKENYGVIDFHHIDLLDGKIIYGPNDGMGIPFEDEERYYVLDLFELLDRIESKRCLEAVLERPFYKSRLARLAANPASLPGVAEQIAEICSHHIAAEDIMKLYRTIYSFAK